jgi:hypothetical protein
MSLQYFKIANRILDRNRVVRVVCYRRFIKGLWQRSLPYQVAIEYEGLTPFYIGCNPIAVPIHSMFGPQQVYINFATEKEAQEAAAKVERLRIKEFAE